MLSVSSVRTARAVPTIRTIRTLQTILNYTLVCSCKPPVVRRARTRYSSHHSAVYFCSNNNNQMAEEMQQVWRRTDCVCFDVDSTVITEEGIDELAKFCNKGNEVANLTSKAMSGTMTFQESLKLRLDIIRPTTHQLRDFIKTKPPTLTPGIRKLVENLQGKNIPIYLISGGFKSIIWPIAQQLNIPYNHIYANKLIFTTEDPSQLGEFVDFDREQQTSKSGGKAVVINLLKAQHGYKNVVLIGDGATDLEACPPADGFIGYGGNVIREAVRSKAKWYVTDFNELIEALKH